MVKRYQVLGLENFPLVKPGDDIGEIIVSVAKAQKVEFEDGDIIVVAQKIVSKSEGRLVDLPGVKASRKAKFLAKRSARDPRLIQCALRQSKRVLKASRKAFVVENKQGIICLNAGLDRSNVAGGNVCSILPEDPNGSAERIRRRLLELTGKKVGVLISDSFSRPFRRGITEFAIGYAGIKPFKDYRGKKDLFGYELKFKVVAAADEVASAAELVMGQGDEGIPVAVVKGLGGLVDGPNPAPKKLTVSRKEDLFRGVL